MEFNQEGKALFPARGVAIIDALMSLAPVRELANGDDEKRRQATRMIVEQMRFEGFNVGGKARNPSAPISKDTIAFKGNGRFFVWDWQNGPTRERQVNAGDPGNDITGDNPAFFEWPAVNHLAVEVNQPSQPTRPPDPPAVEFADAAAVMRKLNIHDGKFNSIASLLEQMIELFGKEIDQTQEAQARIEQKLDALAIVIGNTGQNVAEALDIARDIKSDTRDTKGQAEAAGTNIQQAVNVISDVAQGVAPLIKLLAAIRK